MKTSYLINPELAEEPRSAHTSRLRGSPYSVSGAVGSGGSSTAAGSGGSSAAVGSCVASDAAGNKVETVVREGSGTSTTKFIGKDGDLTETIIGAAIEVHKEFGCGLKEEAYEAALCWELRQRGLSVRRQVPCPVVYKGVTLSEGDDHPKRIDVLVEERVVVELKAVARNEPVFAAQCLTYLKMLGLEVGLVLNFGFPTLKQGIRYVLNTPSASLRSGMPTIKTETPTAPNAETPTALNMETPAALNTEEAEMRRRGDFEKGYPSYENF